MIEGSFNGVGSVSIMGWFLGFLYLLFSAILELREREREGERGGEREREREMNVIVQEKWKLE